MRTSLKFFLGVLFVGMLTCGMLSGCGSKNAEPSVNMETSADVELNEGEKKNQTSEDSEIITSSVSGEDNQAIEASTEFPKASPEATAPASATEEPSTTAKADGKATASPSTTTTPKATATPKVTATPKATATPVVTVAPTATPKPTSTPVPTPEPTPALTGAAYCAANGHSYANGPTEQRTYNTGGCSTTTEGHLVYCTVCGWESFEDLRTVSTNHNTVETLSYIAPTCTENGRTGGMTCDCGQKYQAGGEMLPARGHNMSPWRRTGTILSVNASTGEVILETKTECLNGCGLAEYGTETDYQSVD